MSSLVSGEPVSDQYWNLNDLLNDESIVELTGSIVENLSAAASVLQVLDEEVCAVTGQSDAKIVEARSCCDRAEVLMLQIIGVGNESGGL